MKDKARDTAGLIYKYLKKGLTSSEKQRLWEWITESEANQKYFESITSRAELESILEQVEYPDKEAIWQKIATESEDATIPSLPYMMHTPSRFKWWKYVAAASIVLLGVTGWFYFNHSNGAAKMEDVTARFKDDVPPPTGNRTVLTLADGRVLALDSVGTGMLAQQGNTRISLQDDGRLLYQLKGSATATDAYNNPSQKGNPQNGSGETAQLHGAKTTPLLYNTISTARGGSYHLQLPDGSQVWINAASSLRFPAAFNDSERRVELTGEAYFEIKPQYVAGNKQQKIPFKVSIRTASGMDKGEIDVLGTKFNVNAYEDEQLIRTTLTEGSVKLNYGVSHSLLKPGQQGLIQQNDNNKTASIKIQPTPNEEEVLAWKNGLFVFDNTSLETIMRNVARWYDVSVVYEEKVSGGLHGSIPRDVPLSSVLKILELADGVHFKISGKQITVTR